MEETPPELPLSAHLPSQGNAFAGEGVQNEANFQGEGSEMNALAQILPWERRGSPHSISTRHTKLLSQVCRSLCREGRRSTILLLPSCGGHTELQN